MKAFNKPFSEPLSWRQDWNEGENSIAELAAMAVKKYKSFVPQVVVDPVDNDPGTLILEYEVKFPLTKLPQPVLDALTLSSRVCIGVLFGDEKRREGNGRGLYREVSFGNKYRDFFLVRREGHAVIEMTRNYAELDHSILKNYTDHDFIVQAKSDMKKFDDLENDLIYGFGDDLELDEPGKD